MKSKSRSILHVVRENDNSIPVNLLIEKCKYTLFKLSYFRNVKLTLKYTSNDDKQNTILTISGLPGIKNNEDTLAQFIINRIDIGLAHNINEIKLFYLSYTYEKQNISSPKDINIYRFLFTNLLYFSKFIIFLI
jgi:hypothetical protein